MRVCYIHNTSLLQVFNIVLCRFSSSYFVFVLSKLLQNSAYILGYRGGPLAFVYRRVLGANYVITIKYKCL